MSILVSGDANLDLLAKVERLPQAGEEVEALSLEKAVGGVGANVAVTVARLGGLCGYLACLGNDEAGAFVLRELRAQGVGVGWVRSDPFHPTGMVFVAVDDRGEKMMFAHRGANLLVDVSWLGRIDLSALAIVHLSAPAPGFGCEIARLARDKGVRVSLDPGSILSQRGLAAVENILPWADLLLLNERECYRLSGKEILSEACQYLASLGVGIIAIKRGEKGAALYTKGRLTYYAGFAVEVVDTTGAGDCFDGAFLYGWERGWDLETCALWANAAGALATTKPGAQAGIPTYRELKLFLEEGGEELS